MFDRGKRDDTPGQGTEARPPETRPADPQRSYQAASARPAERGTETAVIGRSIQIEGAVRGNEDLRIEGDVSGTVELKDRDAESRARGRSRSRRTIRAAPSTTRTSALSLCKRAGKDFLPGRISYWHDGAAPAPFDGSTP